MEILKDVIERFLSVSYGYGKGNGYCNGDGYGNGNAYGNVDGHGIGTGNGDGHGKGNGDGYDNCNVYGDVYGGGNGDGYGNGNGKGNGYGIHSINGNPIYNVDSMPTVIKLVHGNYAFGYTLKYNVILVPCYIAKFNDCFAHGKTLKDAVKDAMSKWMNDIPLDDRIDEFMKEYPYLDSVARCSDLFRWHNILTGSCELGREQFCEQHGISINDRMSVKEFCEIAADSYGGEKIIKLKERYIDENRI